MKRDRLMQYAAFSFAQIVLAFLVVYLVYVFGYPILKVFELIHWTDAPSFDSYYGDPFSHINLMFKSSSVGLVEGMASAQGVLAAISISVAGFYHAISSTESNEQIAWGGESQLREAKRRAEQYNVINLVILHAGATSFLCLSISAAVGLSANSFEVGVVVVVQLLLWLINSFAGLFWGSEPDKSLSAIDYENSLIKVYDLLRVKNGMVEKSRKSAGESGVKFKSRRTIYSVLFDLFLTSVVPIVVVAVFACMDLRAIRYYVSSNGVVVFVELVTFVLFLICIFSIGYVYLVWNKARGELVSGLKHGVSINKGLALLLPSFVAIFMLLSWLEYSAGTPCWRLFGALMSVVVYCILCCWVWKRINGDKVGVIRSGYVYRDLEKSISRLKESVLGYGENGSNESFVSEEERSIIEDSLPADARKILLAEGVLKERISEENAETTPIKKHPGKLLPALGVTAIAFAAGRLTKL